MAGGGWWSCQLRKPGSGEPDFPFLPPAANFQFSFEKVEVIKKKKSAALPRFLLACKFSYLVVGVWGRRGIRIK